MTNSLPPDLVDSIITTIGVALGYVIRWIQVILTKKKSEK